MFDEKTTDVEETEVAEEVTVNEEESCADEELCEDENAEENAQEIDEELSSNEKKSGNKGLVVNAILTGLMLIALIANLFVTFDNSDRIKALESDLADTKEVLSYGLTGSPYEPIDFAGIAKDLREARAEFEKTMEDMETQQAPAEETEEAPAEEENNETTTENK